MSSAAERMKRYRLARYRRPEPRGRKTLMRILLLVVCVWLAYQVIASDHGLVKIARTKTEIKSFEREAELLTTEKAALDRAMKACKDNPFLVEKALRENMGMVKEGEIVYRFEDTEGAREAGPKQ